MLAILFQELLFFPHFPIFHSMPPDKRCYTCHIFYRGAGEELTGGEAGGGVSVEEEIAFLLDDAER